MAKKKKSTQFSRTNSSPVTGGAPAAAAILRTPWWRRLWVKAVAVCTVVAAIKSFAYPVIVDFYDGKFGGEMVLTVDNVPLNRDIPTYVFFPVGQAKPVERFLIPVGLALRNEATVKATDVTVSARFDKAANRLGMTELLGHHYSGPRMVSDLSNEVNGNERYDFTVHRIKFLVPKEEFSLSEGGLSYNIPPNLEPFEPLLYSAHRGLNLQVTAFSERNEKLSWEIRYRAVNANNLEQISQFMKSFYAKQVAIDLRKKFGTSAYLWRILFGKDVSVVAYVPNFGHFVELGLYAPKDMPKDYTYYRFDPYKLSLLFDRPTE